MRAPTNPSDRRKRADTRALQQAGFLMHTEDDGALVCKLVGPDDTPYVGRTWRVRFVLPREYPFKSPSVGFVDKMFNPNVDYESGSICLNVLNQEWTPVYNLVTIMRTLLPQLLTYPNANDPLNEEASALWQTDKEAFRLRC